MLPPQNKPSGVRRRYDNEDNERQGRKRPENPGLDPPPRRRPQHTHQTASRSQPKGTVTRGHGVGTRALLAQCLALECSDSSLRPSV